MAYTRFAGAAAAVLCLAHPAWADEPASDSVAAQALFDQAKQLMAAGKFAEACPKLLESQKLDPGSGTLLNLADCYEKEGKIATAWSKFLEAAAAAQTAGKADREHVARDRAAALAPKLAHLTINVAANDRALGLEVKRDDIPVGSAQWGVPIPSDKGAHTLTASAPGRKTWEQLINVADGASTTVTVPALEKAAPEPASAAPASIAPAGPVTPLAGPAAPTTDSGGSNTQRTVGIATFSVGVVGLGVGAVYGALSIMKHGDAASYCDGPACRDQRGIDFKDEARSDGNISTVAFLVGGAVATGGAILWLTAKPTPGSASVAPLQLALGAGSVAVRGSW